MFTGCGDKKQQREFKGKNKIETSTFKLEGEEGYGYEIKVNGKLFIRQDIIPAIQGKNYFKSKKDALKIANLMKKKMERGEVLPNVTKEEIEKELGIKF